jgi:DNA-binding phage protein
MNGIGQNFDDFLLEQGLYDEVKELGAQKLIALQLKKAMEDQKLTTASVARKMHTSRGDVENILDPSYNPSIGTLRRFASVVGKKLSVSLE